MKRAIIILALVLGTTAALPQGMIQVQPMPISGQPVRFPGEESFRDLIRRDRVAPPPTYFRGSMSGEGEFTLFPAVVFPIISINDPSVGFRTMPVLDESPFVTLPSGGVLSLDGRSFVSPGGRLTAVVPEPATSSLLMALLGGWMIRRRAR